MYGVGGAMVVAAHAMGAMSLPFGTALRHADVVQRAFPLTTSASRALRIGAEAAVCDDKTIKDRLHHIGLQPGEFAPQRFKTSLFASAYQLGDTRQFRLGFGYLSFFIFRSVQRKARKSEIGFRHLQTKTGVQAQARLAQDALEHPMREGGLVPAGADKPHIRRLVTQAYIPISV